MELNEKKDLVKSIVVSMVAGCASMQLNHEEIVENAVDLMHEVDRTLEALDSNDEEVEEEEDIPYTVAEELRIRPGESGQDYHQRIENILNTDFATQPVEFTQSIPFIARTNWTVLDDSVSPEEPITQPITPHEEENVTYERLEPESTGLMTPEQMLTEMTQATFGNNNPLDEEQIAMMAILEEQANTPAPVTAIPDLITPSFPSAGTADTIPIEVEEDIEEDEDFEFDDEDDEEFDDEVEEEPEVVQQAAPVVVDHRFDSYGWPEDSDPPIK